VNEVTFYVLLF